MKKMTLMVAAALMAFAFAAGPAASDVLSQPKADYIVLTNGDVLVGAILNESLTFHPYSGGRYSIDVSLLGSLRLQTSRIWITHTLSILADRAESKTGDTMYGQLEDPLIDIKLLNGGVLQIQKKKIQAISFDKNYVEF